LRDVVVATKVHDPPFGAATYCARDVQRCCLRCAAGNDESPERFELALALVDRALELLDAIVIDARLRELLAHLLRVGRRKQRADREQVALNGHEHFIDARHHLHRASHAEYGVQLIDVAVGFDSRVVFADSPAAEEACVAAVARLRVDLRGHASKVYSSTP
jgi:methylphosphotriester-DNA--protein-cysteine methyltransferase